MLAALRRVVTGDREVRAGDWTVQPTKELRNLRVGVVGFGRIRRALTARLTPFGTTVLAYDPAIDDLDVLAAGARPATLLALAAECDVVSLHAPGVGTVVDTSWLAHASPGLTIINTARASLVNELAVATALRAGRLQDYASDDLGEGHVGLNSPLLAEDLVDRVIIMPHTAAQTVEAVDNMGAGATAAVLAGSPPPNLVGHSSP